MPNLPSPKDFPSSKSFIVSFLLVRRHVELRCLLEANVSLISFIVLAFIVGYLFFERIAGE